MARRRRWAIQEEKRIACEIELQAHLNRLLLDEKDRQVEELMKTRSYDDIQEEMAEIEQQCVSCQLLLPFLHVGNEALEPSELILSLFPG